MEFSFVSEGDFEDGEGEAGRFFAGFFYAAEVEFDLGGPHGAVHGAAALAFHDEGEGGFGALFDFGVGGGAGGEFGVEIFAGGVDFFFDGEAELVGGTIGPGEFFVDDAEEDVFEDGVVEGAEVHGVELEDVAGFEAEGVVEEILEGAGAELFELGDAHAEGFLRG